MIDLIHFFEQYNGDLNHHRAAINELMRAMPDELLDENSDWVSIFEAAESEWAYTKIVGDRLINNGKTTNGGSKT